MSADRPVRTRFAPSPTGYLHIGGVRTALFNYLFAKHHGGQFVLRIDDTDQQRNVEAALQPILDGFRWLELPWDEGPEVGGDYGPYFQSQRLDKYQTAVEKLLASGHAYRDFSTPEEYAAERDAAQAEKRSFLYSRNWMAESDADVSKFEAEGRQGTVRLKMPRDGKCEFVDRIRGEMSFDWAREQDTVIQRADGSCTYHLASVVDDYEMQISHVIRAEEHLSNTPRQVFIAQSLGYGLPEYAHLPYVAEPGSKSKLSKRKIDKYLKNKDFKDSYDAGDAIAKQIGLTVSADTFNPVLVDFYREVGYLPDAIINYLVLLGWSLDDKTEEFTRDQMVEYFSLERVNKAPASFDSGKLTAFQQRAMNQLPIKQKVAACLPFLQKAGFVADPPPCDIADHLKQVLDAAGERIGVAGDVLKFTCFFIDDEQLEFEEKAFEKGLVKNENWKLLQRYRDALTQWDNWEPAALETMLKDEFCARESIKLRDIVLAIRVAITGESVGFSLFDSLAILGKESCLRRMERAIERVQVS